MNARHLVFGLLLLAPLLAKAQRLELMDFDVARKQKIGWQIIATQNARLTKQLEEARAQSALLAQAEVEQAALVQRVSNSTDVVRFLSDRRYRAWTSAKGAKISARVLFQNESYLRLKTVQGEVFEIPVTDISDADRAYLGRVANALGQSASVVEAKEPEFLGLDDTKTKTIRKPTSP